MLMMFSCPPPFQVPQCAPCPAGYKCENASQPPVACDPGYYSQQGKSTCEQCTAGQACADPSKAPITCPVGTYSDMVGFDKVCIAA